MPDPASPDPATLATSDIISTIQKMGQHGHNGAIGFRYLAHGIDWAELALNYRTELTADHSTGILASGPIIALMDVTTSIAVWIRERRFIPQATLDLRVDYLRAAVPGRAVMSHGECYRTTRRIAFVRGIAHDGDPTDPIANVAGTFMFLDVE